MDRPKHRYVPTTIERVRASEPQMKRKWTRRWLRESLAFGVPWLILWYFVDEILATCVFCAWIGFSIGSLVTYGRALADNEATLALVYGENWRHNATIGHMNELSRYN